MSKESEYKDVFDSTVFDHPRVEFKHERNIFSIMTRNDWVTLFLILALTATVTYAIVWT